MKEKARKILAMLITAVFVMGITPVVWAQDNNGGAGGGSSDIGIPPQANPISPNNSAVPEVLFDAFAFSPLVTSVLPDRRLTTDERQAWVDNYWAQSGPTAFELEVAAVVNRIRVEDHGLEPVAVDLTLMTAARFHSQIMAQFGTSSNWSHNPGPYRIAGRRHGASYNAATAFGGRLVWGGGNAFSHWTANNNAAEATVRGWMNSSGHRAYILSPEHRFIGVGRTTGAQVRNIKTYMFMSANYSEPVHAVPEDVAVNTDRDALTWHHIRGVNTSENIRTSLILPTSGGNGTTVSWQSSNTAVMDNSGVVVRPPTYGENVTLTATVSRGAYSETISFNITVAPEDNDIIVRALNHPTAHINLTTGRIYLPFRAARFSRNGGARWTNRALPADPASLFNRELTLSVMCNRRHWMGSSQIDFPTINARPRANHERLRLWYSSDTWTLRARPTGANDYANPPDAPSGSYEWVQGNTANGRFPADPQWEALPAGFGLDVIPTPPRGVRNVHFFRSAPSAENGVYIPAGRHFRIRPAAFRRALNLPINYANETIRTRIGQEYSTDGGSTWTPIPTETVNNRSVAVPIDVSEMITTGSALHIRTQATGRRVRSIDQIINPLPRAELAEPLPFELPITNGVINAQALRPYSVLITAPNGTRSWRSLPRINASNAGEFTIRVNPTARRSGSIWSGYAASLSGTLTVNWGVVGQDSRNRDIMGVTRAVITPYGVAPPAPTALPQTADLDYIPPDITTGPALGTVDIRQ